MGMLPSTCSLHQGPRHLAGHCTVMWRPPWAATRAGHRQKSSNTDAGSAEFVSTPADKKASYATKLNTSLFMLLRDPHTRIYLLRMPFHLKRSPDSSVHKSTIDNFFGEIWRQIMWTPSPSCHIEVGWQSQKGTAWDPGDLTRPLTKPQEREAH